MKVCVVSTQLTVCIARPPTHFAFKGHHHLLSQTTGVMKQLLGCSTSKVHTESFVVITMEEVASTDASVTGSVIKAHKTEKCYHI